MNVRRELNKGLDKNVQQSAVYSTPLASRSARFIKKPTAPHVMSHDSLVTNLWLVLKGSVALGSFLTFETST